MSITFDSQKWSNPLQERDAEKAPRVAVISHAAARDWFSGANPLGSFTDRWVDDPRWQGASAFGHLADQARFRGLVETVGSNRFLVLMWHIKVDPVPQEFRYPRF